MLLDQLSLDELAGEDPVYLQCVIPIALDVTVDDLFKTPTIKVRSGACAWVEQNVLQILG
jgi:hypothetical protein